MLAQLERDEALAKGYWNLSLIVLVGLLAVLLLVVMFLGRRWKRRQHLAIEQARQSRRAGQSAERVDAWQASAHRYVDQDKLTEDDAPLDDMEEGLEDDDLGEAGELLEDTDDSQAIDEDEDAEERDPFGLFHDKPYRDTDDEDDLEEPEDFDDLEDWDEDPEDDDPKGRP